MRHKETCAWMVAGVHIKDSLPRLTPSSACWEAALTGHMSYDFVDELSPLISPRALYE